MRPAVAAVLASLIGAIALPACDEGDDVETLTRELIGHANEQVDLVCGDCSDDFGFERRSDCDDAFGLIGPSQQRCIIDAYSRDADASSAYLQCVNDLEIEFTACLEQRLECSDASSIEACGDDYQLGRERCIELPRTISRALEDCVATSSGEGGG